MREVGDNIWGTDSRLAQTCRDYVNPGRYTKRWLNKKQARYISPVRMFLIINLVYFLSLSFLNQFGLNFDTFVTPFYSQLNNQIYSGLMSDSATSIIASSGIEESQFAALYNDRVFTISNSFIIILTFLASAILYMVNFNRCHLLYHHTTMGFYYGGYLLLIFLAANILLVTPILILDHFYIIPTWMKNDYTLSSLLVACLFLFSLISQQHMYGEKKSITFLKSVVITFLFTFFGVIFYRFILFWITTLSILIFP